MDNQIKQQNGHAFHINMHGHITQTNITTQILTIFTKYFRIYTQRQDAAAKKSVQIGYHHV